MTVAPFGIQSVKLNGTYYTGVQGHGGDYGAEIISPESDGVVHETLHSIGRLSPRANFATLAIGTMLDALDDNEDAPMKALDGTNGLVMVGAKDDTNAPNYASGSVHEALTGLRGLVYMTGISCQGGANPAVMSLGAAFSSSDGTTAALVPSAVALPTQPVPAEAWVLSSIAHNATELDGFSNLNWSCDCRVRQIHSGSDVYPRMVSAGGSGGPIRHRITFDTTDLAWLRSIGALGSTSSLAFTFTQLAQGGTRSLTTRTITVNGRLGIVRNPGTGSQGGAMSGSVEFLPRFDGTNKPVTW